MSIPIKHHLLPEAIDHYIDQHCQAEPELLQALIKKSYQIFPNAYKLSGRQVGRFLKMMVQISQAKFIMDIGTFTGYSALSMAEGLHQTGKIMSCDTDAKALTIAKEFIQQSPYKDFIELRQATGEDTLDSITETIDFAFIDADKNNYPLYFEKLFNKMSSGGIMIFDNMLWQGKVLQPEAKTDHSLHQLNEILTQHSLVENVMLSIRDGLQLVRKK